MEKVYVQVKELTEISNFLQDLESRYYDNLDRGKQKELKNLFETLFELYEREGIL